MNEWQDGAGATAIVRGDQREPVLSEARAVERRGLRTAYRPNRAHLDVAARATRSGGGGDARGGARLPLRVSSEHHIPFNQVAPSRTVKTRSVTPGHDSAGNLKTTI